MPAAPVDGGDGHCPENCVFCFSVFPKVLKSTVASAKCPPPPLTGAAGIVLKYCFLFFCFSDGFAWFRFQTDLCLKFFLVSQRFLRSTITSARCTVSPAGHQFGGVSMAPAALGGSTSCPAALWFASAKCTASPTGKQVGGGTHGARNSDGPFSAGSAPSVSTYHWK